MGHATSHRLKWGPFPPNEVGRIVQHIRKGEGRKEGKDGVGRDCIENGKAFVGSFCSNERNNVFLCSQVIKK